MIEAVFFDLDGTLADTAADLGGALDRLRAEQGLPPLPAERVRPHVSKGVRGLLRVGFGIESDHPDYAQLQQRFLSHYESALCQDTALFDGMAAALDTLDAAGIKWGIVTNNTSRYTLPVVGALGLADRAACIVSGDSSPRPKPAPDPLLLASALAGTDAKQCLYVGDDLRDIQSARAAGMGAIAAAWGYLGDERPLEEWGADTIIQSPADIAGLLG